ncbi:LacI family DNA-binding transcriptional regulator [Brachybacterium alimentarium]|uniref:LacI family transcriptional regulator n=1 Tax=Brachybacterium alimentarium TaxID=47845 RepID=A0A2A3YFU2_9MICO|nr:LacI family DNA-binding transcriptional regulator [Brachybacterium alimentarium]PCC32413.1 LacI family transcriptional regulator [Brachybacterium alimentarium]PCC37965.1 LacI family transcriptional regulator [Brachybacterium alimentarium]RCS71693.1 LacI family transcriptional regulator [Brachybacterium alimentarium]
MSTPRPRNVTMRDIAEQLGVSIKTVSNVVNDRPNVGPLTRVRVQEAIRVLNYRPQVGAQQMRTGTSGLITLAIPSLAGTYFSELAQAFADEAQRRRRSIMLHSTAGGREEEHSVLAGFTRVLGDGVVFNPLLIGEDRLAHLGRTILPTVFIGEHVEEAGLPAGSDYVRTDNRGAAHEATAHLQALGRRRIAYLGALDSSEAQQAHSTSRLRLDGYDRALKAAGGVSPVIQTVPGWNQEGGLEAVRTLLQEHPEVDAIVCGNDDLARGALLGLRGMGIDVPGQVSVIGHDNILEAPFTSPPLTTIDPDKRNLAATVLDLLLERIGGHDGPPRVVEAPYRLVERGSTAARR